MGRGRLAMLAAAVALGALGVRLTAGGLRQVLRLRRERARLSARVFHLLGRNERLRKRISRLHSDDLFLEELARRRLGLVRDGEIVYRFAPRRHRRR